MDVRNGFNIFLFNFLLSKMDNIWFDMTRTKTIKEIQISTLLINECQCNRSNKQNDPN